ncbi:glucuronate isomerase [Ereboglobus luteus]|uniref:Uronate isomerase n=1 Tax=Ereboglobus luteus TaxID=1796921 RepID=A0A2U8E2X2_9BACT|nr:glucuronate isomerase [Ereboglobus luteus]AWI09054.1 glucuronate isomerase [Ereboglobus luteus]
MAKPFLPETFLLDTPWARSLYKDHAAKQPIFDYHCHLPPDQIASNHQFENLYKIWLAGDHYKWRAMRSNGIPEDYITGDKTSDYDKFLAWCKTVPQTLRNPLYHWSHLELRRYFGINLVINEANAPKIWKLANAKLKTKAFSTHGILTKNRVNVVCTTDDPVDSLEHHIAIAKSKLKTRVYPTFRPDKALVVNSPAVFNAWCDQLSARANIDVKDLDSLLRAIDNRHEFFHSIGARVSDHGMENIPDADCTEKEAAAIFKAARAGKAASPENTARFTWFMMLAFGRLDAKRGWTKQLHLGAIRNNNTRLLKRLGADAGVDSIGDFPQARGLARYLDRLDSENALPKTVIYNLNPADNYVFATMIGNVQDDLTPGKIQFGSGWWFLDQAEGMKWQINALSQLGLLSRFVGMLTDSRSFMSYVRHEYFRRVLCKLVGGDVDAGLIPADKKLVGGMIEDICYKNAKRYFGLETGNM